MSLSNTDESALVIATTEALQESSISKFSVHLPKKWSETATSRISESGQRYLKKHLDDGGLEQFVEFEMNLAYRAAGEKPAQKMAKVTTLRTFSDPFAFSKSLISSLGALPRQYRLVVRGPAELADRLDRVDVDLELSPRLRLRSGALISGDFVLAHTIDDVDTYLRDDEISNAKPVLIDEKALYFDYRASGCISRRSDSRIIREFSDMLRAFYGAAIAYDILSNYDFRNEELVPWVAANLLEGKSTSLAHVSRADDDIVKAVNLATTVKYDEIIDGKLETLEESLKPISSMFTSEDGSKLITAAIWVFRASISPRQMDRVLESTIAIEVLLGDREANDRVGLSKLMANRCAYSLGRDVKDRRDILDFFVEFYKVRSDIVHSGILKISDDKRNIVAKGLTLAKRILRHEVSLLA